MTSSRIKSHLEPSPLIVPPVLLKSSLTHQPVLQAVWTLAEDRLISADRVIFVGYSLPVTDIAARSLFSETMMRLYGRSKRSIEVVNWAESSKNKRRVIDAYRDVFKGLPAGQFRFGGAAAWIHDVAGEYFTDGSERAVPN